jgi:hypothetical protein
LVSSRKYSLITKVKQYNDKIGYFWYFLWIWNYDILRPTKVITYLGSTWGFYAVKRKTEVSRYLERLWNYKATIRLKGRQQQRVRGYLLYYLSFAGPYNAVVVRILKMEDKRVHNRIINQSGYDPVPRQTARATTEVPGDVFGCNSAHDSLLSSFPDWHLRQLGSSQPSPSF